MAAIPENIDLSDYIRRYVNKKFSSLSFLTDLFWKDNKNLNSDPNQNQQANIDFDEVEKVFYLIKSIKNTTIKVKDIIISINKYSIKV